MPLYKPLPRSPMAYNKHLYSSTFRNN